MLRITGGGVRVAGYGKSPPLLLCPTRSSSSHAQQRSRLAPCPSPASTGIPPRPCPSIKDTKLRASLSSVTASFDEVPGDGSGARQIQKVASLGMLFFCTTFNYTILVGLLNPESDESDTKHTTQVMKDGLPELVHSFNVEFILVALSPSLSHSHTRTCACTHAHTRIHTHIYTHT